MGLFLKKNHILSWWELNCFGALISITKTASKKIGLGFLHCFYRQNCFQENQSLDWLHEVSFSYARPWNNQVTSFGITWVDMHLNWQSWFRFLILEEGPLVILIFYITFVIIPTCFQGVYVDSLYLGFFFFLIVLIPSNSMPCSGCSHLHVVNQNYKKGLQKSFLQSLLS